jgi:hypothetical protein
MRKNITAPAPKSYAGSKSISEPPQTGDLPNIAAGSDAGEPRPPSGELTDGQHR